MLALLSAKLDDDIKAGTKVVADRAQVMKDYRAELDGLQNQRMVCPMHSGFVSPLIRFLLINSRLLNVS